MKADNPYFMAVVDLQGAKIDVDKAIKVLEQNLPGSAFSICQLAIKELLACMDKIHARRSLVPMSKDVIE
jgi:hypothetical protein